MKWHFKAGVSNVFLLIIHLFGRYHGLTNRHICCCYSCYCNWEMCVMAFFGTFLSKFGGDWFKSAAPFHKNNIFLSRRVLTAECNKNKIWKIECIIHVAPGYGSRCSVPRQTQTEDLGQHFHVGHQDHWWEIRGEFCHFLPSSEVRWVLFGLLIKAVSSWLRWLNTSMWWTRSPSSPET